MTIRAIRPTIAWTLTAAVLASLAGLFGVYGPSSASAQSDTTAPTISSIAITSDPDDDIHEDVPYWRHGGMRQIRPAGIYGIGDEIEVTVTFSEDITVIGTPQLVLDIGGVPKSSGYLKVDGRAVVFRYAVAEGDRDADGVAIGAHKITLHGGDLIRDAAGNDADLSHDGLAVQTGHRVDGIRPGISVGFISHSDASDGFYTFGDEILVEVKPLGGDTAYAGATASVPQLTLDFGGETRAAEWVSYTFGNFFRYVVQEGDLDTDGVAISPNSISLNGGFIKDEAGNDAILTHGATKSKVAVDAVAPAISSIDFISDPGNNDTYDAGDKIEVAVTFNEDVSVAEVWRSDVEGSSTPYIELNMGGEAREAGYQSYKGAKVVFSYTVQAGDSDANGVSIGANRLFMNGGIIYDAAGNNPISAALRISEVPLNAVVSHSPVADDSSHKVAGSSSSLTLQGPTTTEYRENSNTQVGQIYRVSGTNATVGWSLSGEDGNLFSFRGSSSSRGLQFISEPNYEDPKDANADNEYRLTIEVSDGANTASLQVVVFVTNQVQDADEVPTIVGAARVGETLTADLSRITPFSLGPWYWWLRGDGDTFTEIDGANDAQYKLTADDEGKKIKVRVNYYRGVPFYSLVSEPTDEVVMGGL